MTGKTFGRGAGRGAQWARRGTRRCKGRTAPTATDRHVHAAAGRMSADRLAGCEKFRVRVCVAAWPERGGAAKTRRVPSLAPSLMRDTRRRTPRATPCLVPGGVKYPDPSDTPRTAAYGRSAVGRSASQVPRRRDGALEPGTVNRLAAGQLAGQARLVTPVWPQRPGRGPREGLAPVWPPGLPPFPWQPLAATGR